MKTATDCQATLIVATTVPGRRRSRLGDSTTRWVNAIGHGFTVLQLGIKLPRLMHRKVIPSTCAVPDGGRWITSPELDLPPMRLRATASVSWASRDKAPSDIPPVQNLRCTRAQGKKEDTRRVQNCRPLTMTKPSQRIHKGSQL